jgi:hypothetical protein
VEVDVEAARVGDSVDLMGQIVGAPVTEVAVEDAGGVHPTDLDPLGRFVAGGLRPGAVRIRFRSAGGKPVRTPWAVI